jgi:hypothetical protein
MMNPLAKALLATLLPAIAMAAEPLTPLPAPPIPAAVESGAALEPEVTIIETGQETLYEYRVNGVRYMIKVQPKGAPAYYLLDSDGDGTLDVREDSPTDISVPRWVLFSW